MTTIKEVRESLTVGRLEDHVKHLRTIRQGRIESKLADMDIYTATLDLVVAEIALKAIKEKDNE